jgi:hypothetical protein
MEKKMKNKQYNVLPRMKKYLERAGSFSFNSLKVSLSGDGDIFFSSSAILMPDVKIEKSNYHDANIRVSVSPDFSPFNEYCSLRITESFIEVHCRDRLGARNAVSLIAQLTRKTESGYVIDCAQIEDWPDAQYRACMVESSGRVWIPMDRILRYIREMAMCRMNVFMFHFMEDKGCTVPLETVPQLKGYGEDDLKYSRVEIDVMLAYAKSLGIRVVPFIEILTHTADIATKLDIACPGDTPESLFAVCSFTQSKAQGIFAYSKTALIPESTSGISFCKRTKSVYSRGSHSAPFTTSISAPSANFAYEGKPAPPAPTIPAFFIISFSSIMPLLRYFFNRQYLQ